MADDFITLEYDGPVAILSNNRPDKHNAITIGARHRFGPRTQHQSHHA